MLASDNSERARSIAASSSIPPIQCLLIDVPCIVPFVVPVENRPIDVLFNRNDLWDLHNFARLRLPDGQHDGDIDMI